MYQSQLGSFRERLQVARQSDDLSLASLLDRQTIVAAFGEASGILDSARIHTTAVTFWVFFLQVLWIDHGCASAATSSTKLYRVRNEIHAHMLAYNLIRQVMYEAATSDGLPSWQISVQKNALDIDQDVAEPERH